MLFRSAKIKSLKKGIPEAVEYFKTGIYDSDLLQKYDMSQTPPFKNKILKEYIDAVGRSLGAEDIVFRRMAISESLGKDAIVTAKNKGLSGQSLRNRVKELLKTPTNNSVFQAINNAEYATYQSDNALAHFISSAKGGEKSKEGLGAQLTYLGSELAMPFTRTPFNIPLVLLDYTPAGFIKAIVRQIGPGRTQRKLVDDLGRAITGSGVIGLGAYLASLGLIRGEAPSGTAKKGMYFAEGPENSIHMGGHWLSLDRITPVGNLLSIGGNIYYNWKEKEGIDFIATVGFQGIDQIAQQPMYQGIMRIGEAIKEPERKGEKYIDGLATSIIPTIVGRITKSINFEMRYPQGIFQEFISKIPFASKLLPKRRDIFGEPIEVPGGHFNIIDPFASRKYKDDPIIKEARKLGINIGLPSGTMQKYKLTNYEYDKFQEIQGKTLKKLLDIIIHNPAYGAVPSAGKVKIWKRIIRETRDSARDQIMKKQIKERPEEKEKARKLKILLEQLTNENREEAMILINTEKPLLMEMILEEKEKEFKKDK